MAGVIDHEMIHALRAKDLFTEKEWNSLRDNAARINHQTEVNAQGKPLTLFEVAQRDYGDLTFVQQQEESVAELYRMWANGEVTVTGKPRSLLQRIADFFKKMSDAMRGAPNVVEVLEKIKAGEIAARPTGEIRTLRILEEQGLLQNMPMAIRQLTPLSDRPGEPRPADIELAPAEREMRVSPVALQYSQDPRPEGDRTIDMTPLLIAPETFKGDYNIALVVNNTRVKAEFMGRPIEHRTDPQGNLATEFLILAKPNREERKFDFDDEIGRVTAYVDNNSIYERPKVLGIQNIQIDEIGRGIGIGQQVTEILGSTNPDIVDGLDTLKLYDIIPEGAPVWNALGANMFVRENLDGHRRVDGEIDFAETGPIGEISSEVLNHFESIMPAEGFVEDLTVGLTESLAEREMRTRDESSGMAADYVPATRGPRASNLLEEVDGDSFSPADIYENPQFYTAAPPNARDPERRAIYQETLAFMEELKRVRGNPNATITMYRAAPTDELLDGDLITPSRTEAQSYVDASEVTQQEGQAAYRARLRQEQIDETGAVNLQQEKLYNQMDDLRGLFGKPAEHTPSELFTYELRAGDVRWDGNQLERWGYFPENVVDIRTGSLIEREMRSAFQSRHERLFDIIRENPDGFTVHPKSLRPATEGWSVAVVKANEMIIDRADITLDDVKLFAQLVRQSAQVIKNLELAPLRTTGIQPVNNVIYAGGWYNPADTTYVLDAAMVVAKEEDALYIAN